MSPISVCFSVSVLYHVLDVDVDVRGSEDFALVRYR